MSAFGRYGKVFLRCYSRVQVRNVPIHFQRASFCVSKPPSNQILNDKTSTKTVSFAKSSWNKYASFSPQTHLASLLFALGLAGFYHQLSPGELSPAEAKAMKQDNIIQQFLAPKSKLITDIDHIPRDAPSSDKIKAILTPNKKGIFVIYGPKNIGKSTLIKQIIDEIEGYGSNKIKPILYVEFEHDISAICNALNVYPDGTQTYYPKPTTDIDQFKDTLNELSLQLKTYKLDKFDNRVPVLVLDQMKTLVNQHYDKYITLRNAYKNFYDNGLLKTVMVISDGPTYDKIVSDPALRGRIKKFELADDLIDFTDDELKQYLHKIIDKNNYMFDKYYQCIKYITNNRIGYVVSLASEYISYDLSQSNDVLNNQMINILYNNMDKEVIMEFAKLFESADTISQIINILHEEALLNVKDINIGFSDNSLKTLRDLCAIKKLRDSNIIKTRKGKYLFDCKPILLIFANKNCIDDIKNEVQNLKT